MLAAASAIFGTTMQSNLSGHRNEFLRVLKSKKYESISVIIYGDAYISIGGTSLVKIRWV